MDLRDGRTLSPDPRLAGLPALDAVARLHRAGLREVIVLDLARVGSGAGPDVAADRRDPRRLPRASSCSPAAACATPTDLRALADAGAAGALVATALHRGVIGPRELR